MNADFSLLLLWNNAPTKKRRWRRSKARSKEKDGRRDVGFFASSSSFFSEEEKNFVRENQTLNGLNDARVVSFVDRIIMLLLSSSSSSLVLVFGRSFHRVVACGS
jgi:hypothetical protein